jgi:hypothetical protein
MTTEQDIQNYYNLIGKVADIDIQAALYLRNEAIHLAPFDYCGGLQGCFVWCDTPQGSKYWGEVDNIIKKGDNL